MQTAPKMLTVDRPVLVFGGPYSNLHATRALFAEAKRRGIPRDHMICTGDLVAYCGQPVETIESIRKSRVHVVMGNCDEQLAGGAQDCGCGFPQGSQCERLSSAWFAFADSQTEAGARRWLGKLPRRIDLGIGGRRLAIIHGSVSTINAFVFATTPDSVKRSELALSGCDGVIGGHCGMPFTQIVDGRLWHNAGVIGMPANDGTPRVWFSVISPGPDGIEIAHCALDYDHVGAASAMSAAGLPSEYRDTLTSGLWPSCDVLPARETAQQGLPLAPGVVVWTSARPMLQNGRAPSGTPDGVLWPTVVGQTRNAQEATVRTPTPASTAAASCCAPAAAPAPSPAASSSCCAPTSNATATRDLYREAALTPDPTLCCTSNTTWHFPELVIPHQMIAMNYGCGSTVHPADLAGSPTVLYVGVGGGLEVLQFAYFSRRRGGVIGIDIVDEMMAACRRNLADAEECNAWFKQSFIDLRTGDALALPVDDASIDVAAQNCLFNIFHEADLAKALLEMSRVLKPGGKLILSDPICDTEIPAGLKADERLRAMCLTGALSLPGYIDRLAASGFGRIEVRARKPYRVLGPELFATNQPILLESVEVCAIKCPVPAGGPQVFAGQSAIYFGSAPSFTDGNGLTLPGNQPLPVSIAEAEHLKQLKRADIYVSQPSWAAAAVR